MKLVVYNRATSKNKKIHPEKKSFIFREMERSCSNIKLEAETPKKLFMFQETETLKSFLYFGKQNF